MTGAFVVAMFFWAPAVGMLILASEARGRLSRAVVSVIAVMAVLVVWLSVRPLFPYVPPCDQLSGLAWWMAGCAFLPMVGH